MSEHPINLDLIKKKLNGHSIFAPSSSAMWSACPGSLIPNLLAPDTAGYEAAEGSVAHMVGETWLEEDEYPSHLLGTTHIITSSSGEEFEIVVDETMIEYVREYVDWVIYMPGKSFIETRVDFSDITPIDGQTGTSDHTNIFVDTLTITDLKYGKGIQVFAEENTQLLLYAYGSYRKFKDKYPIKRIVMRIAQPRLDHFDVWELDVPSFIKRIRKLETAAHAAWCPTADRVPGKKQCQWCKISSDCQAYSVFAHRLVEDIFEDDELLCNVTADEMQGMIERMDNLDDYQITPQPIEGMTIEQKRAILNYRGMIEKWFKNLAADVEAHAKNGGTIEGYKLVEGRVNRQWKSDNSVLSLLDDLMLPRELAYHEPKLKSPAQMEDVLVKQGIKRKELPEVLGDTIRRPPGKPTLVLLSDPRAPLAPADDGIFDTDDLL